MHPANGGRKCRHRFAAAETALRASRSLATRAMTRRDQALRRSGAVNDHYSRPIRSRARARALRGLYPPLAAKSIGPAVKGHLDKTLTPSAGILTHFFYVSSQKRTLLRPPIH